MAQSLLNALKLLNSLKTSGELEYEWPNFAILTFPERMCLLFIHIQQPSHVA